MGSGSFGGAGSGGSGIGAGGTIGHSGYRFRAGRLISSVISISKAQRKFRKLRQKLPREYVERIFGSAMIRNLYEDLFKLSVDIFQNRSWNGVTTHYGVPARSGCLLAWANVVIDRAAVNEHNSKVAETGRSVLEDFLIAAVGNDPDLYLNGTPENVLKSIDKRMFDGTSENFLALLIRRVLEREIEVVGEGDERQIVDTSNRAAQNIVKDFEKRFYRKAQITHRDLFRIIQREPDWFRALLRQ
jgi:hypothetical protein